jgi:hypothetical protein
VLIMKVFFRNCGLAIKWAFNGTAVELMVVGLSRKCAWCCESGEGAGPSCRAGKMKRPIKAEAIRIFAEENNLKRCELAMSGLVIESGETKLGAERMTRLCFNVPSQMIKIRFITQAMDVSYGSSLPLRLVIC